MKRLLILLAFIPLFASAWEVPQHYLPTIKPAFSAPFIKPTQTVYPTVLSGSEPFVHAWIYTTNYGFVTQIDVNMSYSPAAYTRSVDIQVKLFGFSSMVGSVIYVNPGASAYGGPVTAWSGYSYIEYATIKMTPYSN